MVCLYGRILAFRHILPSAIDNIVSSFLFLIDNDVDISGTRIMNQQFLYVVIKICMDFLFLSAKFRTISYTSRKLLEYVISVLREM